MTMNHVDAEPMHIRYIRMYKATMVSDEFVWPQALEKPQLFLFSVNRLSLAKG